MKKILIASFEVSERFGIIVKSRDGRLFHCTNSIKPDWIEITPEEESKQVKSVNEPL